MSSEFVESLSINMPIQPVLTIPSSVVGGVVSWTNTANEAFASFPFSSIAVQSTAEVPKANMLSLGGVQLTSIGVPVAFVAETL